MKKTLLVQIVIILLITETLGVFADNLTIPTNLDNANEAFISGDYEKVCTLTKEIITNKTNNDGKTEAAALLIQSLKWTNGIDYAIKEYKRIKNEPGIKSSGKSSLDEAVETMISDDDVLMRFKSERTSYQA